MSKYDDNEQEELYRKVVEEFVVDVETTGGVRRDKKGYPRPVADEEWIDLGETYLRACAALGREPMLQQNDNEEEIKNDN